MAHGWARNSINTTIFRHNSIISLDEIQYCAFYDEHGQVTIARRSLDSEKWEIKKLKYSGKVKDAHRSISIAIDGNGILHLSWDHHCTKLRYIQIEWGDNLKVSKKLSMTRRKERLVTYPEFYRLKNGDLLFFYRYGFSGRGNLYLNYYDHKSGKWRRISNKLIHGEGERNAYWQVALDSQDNIHLSWNWRETMDVATNHDMCYAKSIDLGETWCKSTGEPYRGRINAKNAEYACHIPQNHELTNTTSMAIDSEGNPYIVSYWREENSTIPQYWLIFNDGKRWKTQQITNRKTPFSLKGGGTKRIPISRPKILIDKKGKIHLIYRDVEFGEKVTLASSKLKNLQRWNFKNLTDFSVSAWEPTFDPELWKRKGILNLFVQCVGQGDLETLEDLPPQIIQILEWIPT